MAYYIDFATDANNDLDAIKKYHQKMIVAAIEKQLRHQPLVETKNRKQSDSKENARTRHGGYYLMKKITIQQFSRNATALVDIAQKERVVVTRQGKPSLVLVGIENKDEEDLALERDKKFWEMIRERRKQKTISLADVKKRLGLRAPRKKKER